MRFSSIISSAAAVTALMASCVSCVTLAAAQELLELPAVPLYDGAAPGSEDPRYPESAVKSPGGRMFVANVSIPDYTPYLPGPSANTRTAVIIAPGADSGSSTWIAKVTISHDFSPSEGSRRSCSSTA